MVALVRVIIWMSCCCHGNHTITQ